MITEKEMEDKEREFSFKEKMQKIELGEMRLSKEKERFLIEQSIQDKHMKRARKKASGVLLKACKAVFNIISVVAITVVILALMPSTREYILTFLKSI